MPFLKHSNSKLSTLVAAEPAPEQQFYIKPVFFFFIKVSFTFFLYKMMFT